MHYEVELALVIGKMVRDLRADDGRGAMEAIRGMFLLFHIVFFSDYGLACLLLVLWIKLSFPHVPTYVFFF